MAVESKRREDLYDQPIDLLVSLAEEGEIDPWNLDLVEITDRFLSAVNAMDRQGLKVCGETLLCAAVLLRMKSDALLAEDEEDDYYYEDDWEPAPMNPLWEDPPELEPPVRRTAPRPATLPELIDELQGAVRRCELREQREHDRTEQQRLSQETVKELPHNERLEERVEELKDLLRHRLADDQTVTMQEMLESDDRHGKITLFLPLLFMDARGYVELEQEELFGTVTIHPLPGLWNEDEATHDAEDAEDDNTQ